MRAKSGGGSPKNVVDPQSRVRDRKAQSGASLAAAICVALVVVTLVAFGAVTRHGFVEYDDGLYVVENEHVRKGLHGDSIAWSLTATAAANWHPVTWISHMLDVELFGVHAGKHHSTNLIVHATSVVLLFLLLVRMTGVLWRPAFAATLFAIHPLHVESVAWIAERKDVLSTLFWLLTLGAWLWWLSSRTTARYVLVIALFALGLMTKPMLVTLPFTLLLFDFWPLKRTGTGLPALLKEKTPLFVMAAASSVATVWAQKAGGALQTLEAFTLSERLANAMISYAGYLWKTVWPVSLAVFYPYPYVGLASPAVAASALILLSITVVAVRIGTKAPYITFGWLWYVGTLLPVIGVVQVGEQGMADRYTYVPLIGIFVAISWSVAALASRSRTAQLIAVIGGSCWIAALLVLTRAQVRTWVDTASLFAHAIAVTKDNWTAHNNLGRVYSEGGRPDLAIPQFEAALRIRPGFAEAHLNLALALERHGRPDEAVARYREALRLKPDYIEAHNNLANTLLRAGQPTKAITHYESALRLKPDYAEAHYNFAIALATSGRRDEAIVHFREALRIQPDFEAAANKLRILVERADR